MEKRNFVTSFRTPGHESVDDMVKQAADLFGDGKRVRDDGFARRASLEDEKADGAR